MPSNSSRIGGVTPCKHPKSTPTPASPAAPAPPKTPLKKIRFHDPIATCVTGAIRISSSTAGYTDPFNHLSGRNKGRMRTLNESFMQAGYLKATEGLESVVPTTLTSGIRIHRFG